MTTDVDPAHRALTPEIAAMHRCIATPERPGGTTSLMDMWRFMEGSASAAERIGIRATLVPHVADAEGFDYFETLESNRRLLANHRLARTAGSGRYRSRCTASARAPSGKC